MSKFREKRKKLDNRLRTEKEAGKKVVLNYVVANRCFCAFGSICSLRGYLGLVDGTG